MITVRKFRDGDEESLCRLYGDAYSSYNGFVHRSASEWKRLYVSHPNVGPERILVAENGALQGYCVYSNARHLLFPQPDMDGTIYDLCLRHGPQSRRAGRMLLRNCIIQAQKEQVERIDVIVPANDPVTKGVLRDCGFAAGRSRLLFGICPIDIKSWLERRYAELQGKGARLIPLELHITQDFSNRLIDFGVNGAVDVVLTSHGAPPLTTLTCGILALMDILLDGKSPDEKRKAGEIAISQPNVWNDVKRALDALRFKGRWFFSAIDWR